MAGSDALSATPPTADRQSMTLGHLGLLLVVNLVWAFATIASKLALDHLPSIFATGLRFALIATVLSPVLRWRTGRMGPVLLIAFLAGAIQFGTFFSGLALSGGVGTVAILTQLGVPFATILSIFLLGETVRWRRWSGILLAFGGTLILGFDPQVFDHPLSAALVVASTFVGAIVSILQRRLDGIGVFQLQAWIATVSAPILLATSALVESGQATALREASLTTLGGIVYAAFGSSLVGHAGMFYLLQRYPVSLVMPLTLVAPFLTVAFGIVFLGDQVTPRLVLGGLITFAGVLIITLRKPETPRPDAP